MWSINSWHSSLGNELEIVFLYGTDTLCCINGPFSNQMTWTKAIKQIKHWGCENVCLKFGKKYQWKKKFNPDQTYLKEEKTFYVLRVVSPLVCKTINIQ